MTRSKFIAVAGVATALTLVACGGSDGGSNGGSHDTMTQGQAQEVSSGITNLVDGAFNATSQFDLTADGTLTDPTTAPPANAHIVTRNRVVAAILGASGRAVRSANPTGPAFDGGILGEGSCNPVHTSLVDADTDNIPNDDVLTFTSTNCNYVNEFGVQVVVSGTVEIKDVGTIWGFSLDFDALTYNLSGNSGSATFIVSGTYSTTVGANLAATQEAIHVSLGNNGGDQVSATASFNFSFVPNTPLTSTATHLPAGNATLTGSWSYTHNSDAWSVVLSTPDPLVYDGSCTTNPVFASGSLEGQIAIARSHGFHVQYNGCGEAPTVTLVGTA